jgi:hypothetical protein
MIRRLANIGKERLVVLGPIVGLFAQLSNSESSVSFEEAIEDIVNYYKCVDPPLNSIELEAVALTSFNHAVDLLHFSQNSTKLNEHEVASLAFISSEFLDQDSDLLTVMNRNLLDENRRASLPFLKLIWLVMQAMSKCPPYDEDYLYASSIEAKVDDYVIGKFTT